jgi:hypothetical protein
MELSIIDESLVTIHSATPLAIRLPEQGVVITTKVTSLMTHSLSTVQGAETPFWFR